MLNSYGYIMEDIGALNREKEIRFFREKNRIKNLHKKLTDNLFLNLHIRIIFERDYQ